ncbi:hypothetical protein B0H14DRAFT_2646120 [Mycena olivaceomarginata]|nr:hypothetical protein B0H14DRAFT_2646120 [Mycena olivaceomarginata]
MSARIIVYRPDGEQRGASWITSKVQHHIHAVVETCLWGAPAGPPKLFCFWIGLACEVKLDTQHTNVETERDLLVTFLARFTIADYTRENMDRSGKGAQQDYEPAQKFGRGISVRYLLHALALVPLYLSVVAMIVAVRAQYELHVAVFYDDALALPQHYGCRTERPRHHFWELLIFLVIGMCAGFFALVMYFFASSSIGVGIFVVMIVFVMGVCPMIWFLLLVLRVRDPESCHEEYK